MIERCVMALFLGWGSVYDFRRREIPALFLAVFAVLGMAVQLWQLAFGGSLADMTGVLAGAAAGVLLLGAARLTEEAIGYGDALTAVVLGIWLGIIPLMEIFFLGLILSAVYSAWLFLVKRRGGKYRIAFLPFLAAGYLIWLILGVKGASG